MSEILKKIKDTWKPEQLWQSNFLTQIYKNDENYPIETWTEKDWNSLIPFYVKEQKKVHSKSNLKQIIKSAHAEKHGDNRFPGDIDKEAKELSEFYETCLTKSLDIAHETVKEGINLLEQPKEFRRGHWDEMRLKARELMEHRRMTKIEPDPYSLRLPEKEILDPNVDYLNTPSQEIITKTGRAITRNQFNYDDPNRKLPYADIGTKDKFKTILEIDPELNPVADNSLGITDEAVDKVLDEIKSNFDADGMGHDVVMRVLLTLWVEKQTGSEASLVEVSLDEVCEKLTSKKRIGEHTFEARKRMTVRKQIETICKLKYKVSKIPDRFRNKEDYNWETIDRIDTPLFDINSRYSPEQQSLVGDDSQTWERIAFMPGLLMVNLIRIYNSMFMRIPTNLYARLKPQQKAERHLGWYLIHQYKFKAKRQGQKQYDFVVKTLLDEAMIPLTPKANDKLAKTLDNLSSSTLKTVKGHKFSHTLESMKKAAGVERITKAILRKWKNTKITIYVPDTIFQRYERLTDKKDDENKLIQ